MDAESRVIACGLDRAFRYDLFSDSWIEDAELAGDIISEKTLEALPVSLIEEGYRDRWTNNVRPGLWCKKHMDYENIDMTAKQTEKGCKLDKLHVVMKKSLSGVSILGEYVPFRWRVRQAEGDDWLKISADVLYIRSEEKFIWRRMKTIRIPKLSLRYIEYSLNMKTTEKKCLPADTLGYWCTDGYSFNVEQAIPNVVIKAGLEKLQQTAKELFGKSFILNEHNWDYGSLWEAVENPYDINICWLKKFLNVKYDDIVSRDCSDNYQAVCKYLEIDPPKSIKKLYLDRPFTLIFYTWLTRLGFTDINAIRLFFAPKIMRRIGFGGVKFNAEDHLIYNFTLPFIYSGMDFVFYVRWMINNGKDEMALAKQLMRFLLEVWCRDYDDMLRMFHAYYPFISEETKQLVKRRGICAETHDELAHEINNIDIKNCQIHYSPEVLALNSYTRGYTFCIVENTMELPQIGRAMHNCVAAYSSNVKSGNTIIAYAKDEEDIQACIEIRVGKRNNEVVLAIVQALGKYNRYLNGSALLACREWAENNNIQICTNQLNLKEGE